MIISQGELSPNRHFQNYSSFLEQLKCQMYLTLTCHEPELMHKKAQKGKYYRLNLHPQFILTLMFVDINGFVQTNG